MMGAISGQYYVYIMTNQHNTVLYTGMTNDLKRRTYEHRTGRGGGNCVDRPGKNWATHFTYMVRCVEVQEEWPEGGTLSVAYEDLPLGGGNDWDYNDFVVDIDTLANFWGTSTDRDLVQMDFTVPPEAKMASYTHVMHRDADTFLCNGTYELYRDGLLVESGNYNDDTGIDVILVPNTGSAPTVVLLTIYFTEDCDFSFPTWDDTKYHGENLFYDPYLHVNNTGEDIHTRRVKGWWQASATLAREQYRRGYPHGRCPHADCAGGLAVADA